MNAILSFLQSKLPKIPALYVSWILLLLYLWQRPQVAAYINKMEPRQLLTDILAGTIISTVSLLIYSIDLHIKNKEKLIYSSGVWWDKNKNPLCLICKTPIIRGFSVFGDKKLFGCKKCDTTVNFIDDDTGEIIDLITAKEKL